MRKYRLGDEPSEDLRGSTTAQQRVEMVWQLTFEAWALTARPLPDYERATSPVSKVLRRAS